MSVKNIIFDEKKISTSRFYKNKKPFNIYDINVSKTLISKKEHYGKKAHLNTLLDIMMMITLGHYVWTFLKWSGMLSTLIVIRQCLSKLIIIDC